VSVGCSDPAWDESTTCPARHELEGECALKEQALSEPLMVALVCTWLRSPRMALTQPPAAGRDVHCAGCSSWSSTRMRLPPGLCACSMRAARAASPSFPCARSASQAPPARSPYRARGLRAAKLLLRECGCLRSTMPGWPKRGVPWAGRREWRGKKPFAHQEADCPSCPL